MSEVRHEHQRTVANDGRAAVAIKWTKGDARWFAIDGSFRLEVKQNDVDIPIKMYRWSVCRSGQPKEWGGFGATNSIAASKKAAELELKRWRNWRREKDAP